MHAELTYEGREKNAGPAERLVLALASRIVCGRLTFRLPDGSARVFQGDRPGPEAELWVHDPRLFRRLLTGGTVGLAESYIDGEWDAPDLTALIELGARNETAMQWLLDGKPWSRFVNRLMHGLRRNTRRGARRNIAAHYDLGNAFYGEWLDPSMTYSAGLFGRPGDDLAQSQINKFRRMAALADIGPDDHVLEIGCGWGGFCEWAAREIGCRVTAVTISEQQYDYTRRRIRAAGLADRVEIRLQDYRDIDGRFDRIVSIEMLEAVGEAYWPIYFAALRDRLKPGGRAALQVITIADSFFDAYRSDADFIQRYIFPGGMLPSPERLGHAAAAAGLAWEETHCHGGDYARSLALWRRRFAEAWPRIAAQGFDERFRRLWTYYLCYCEAGFREGRIDLMQFSLAHADGAR